MYLQNKWLEEPCDQLSALANGHNRANSRISYAPKLQYSFQNIVGVPTNAVSITSIFFFSHFCEYNRKLGIFAFDLACSVANRYELIDGAMFQLAVGNVRTTLVFVL